MVAASRATHGAGDVEDSWSLLVVIDGVLRSSIAVVQQAVCVRSTCFDNFEAELVQHDGEIDPAELRRQAGNIGPGPAGSRFRN